MTKKLAGLCGVLVLFVYGQTQSERRPEERNRCPMTGPSGALVCSNDTLDIVTAVVPRLTAANRFGGLNTFAQGVVMDTREQRRPAWKEELRGALWFKRDEQKDSVQVCMRESGRYEWAGMELHAEQ